MDSIEAVSERSWAQYSAMVGLEENAATVGVDRLKPHYEQLEVQYSKNSNRNSSSNSTYQDSDV